MPRNAEPLGEGFLRPVVLGAQHCARKNCYVHTLENRAKLLRPMVFSRFGKLAPALGAWIAISLAAACGSGGPTGPQPGGSVTVTAVTPSTGSSFGGTVVTITGTGFAAGATVRIGTSTATDVVVVNTTTITAKTAASAPGASDVRVTVGGSLGSLAGAFTFVTPATGPNAPPTVSAIDVTPPKDKQPKTLATIGDSISLDVSVNDQESAADSLTYTWAANPNIGTFTGTGRAVQWKAPATVTSPRTVLITVTVVEKYYEADGDGPPIQKEHRIEKAVTLRVHDSVKEISDMAVDFLTQFSKQVSPDIVMRNFSRTCDDGEGYADELSNVQDHQRDYVMRDYDIGEAVVTFAYGSELSACPSVSAPGDACAKVPVEWHDTYVPTNEDNTVIGDDYVSAVYEGDHWLLCHSKFKSTSSLRFHRLFSKGH